MLQFTGSLLLVVSKSRLAKCFGLGFLALALISKLKDIHDGINDKVAIEGILSIQNGDSPSTLKERVTALMPSRYSWRYYENN
jgi:hypothetical protein